MEIKIRVIGSGKSQRPTTSIVSAALLSLPMPVAAHPLPVLPQRKVVIQELLPRLLGAASLTFTAIRMARRRTTSSTTTTTINDLAYSTVPGDGGTSGLMAVGGGGGWWG